MTSFDPLETEDRIKLAKVIKDMPLATAREIQSCFDRTKEVWDQGDQPAYIQHGAIEDQLQRIFTEVCITINQKTTSFTKNPDGTIAWADDLRKPYIGYLWSYELKLEEKLLAIDLHLEKPLPSRPDNKVWVPFRFMKRTDGVLAFWFHNGV